MVGTWKGLNHYPLSGKNPLSSFWQPFLNGSHKFARSRGLNSSDEGVIFNFTQLIIRVHGVEQTLSRFTERNSDSVYCILQQLLRSKWLLHYVLTTSGCCTHGVALLLTYVGADCCGLEGSYFACALSSAPLYSKSWGSSAPSYLKSFCDQYLLRTFCHTKMKLVVIIMQKETLRCYPRNDQWVSLLYCFNMAHMAPFQMPRALKDYCVLKSYIKPARSF